MRHKSTVDCDFRPRARGFSETTWIFPKHGHEIYKSTLECQRLEDYAWYKSEVNIQHCRADKSTNQESSTYSPKQTYLSDTDSVGTSTDDSSEHEEACLSDYSDKVTNVPNGYASSDESQIYITNNNVVTGKKTPSDVFNSALIMQED